MSATGTTAFVTLVERRIAALLAPDPSAWAERNTLAAASRHLCLGNGGKRVRSRLVLLLGRAAGASEPALEAVATSAELIHAASLLHDDVVDEASLRRGKPSVNAGWGNQVAVLAGDWLLSSAFSVLRPHPREVTSEAIEVVAEMSRAAIAELEARGRADLTLERWRAIAAGKTGALFGWCGQAAARVAGRDDLAARFDAFGRRLGVAFQLADDLKDIWSDEGKDRFADLKNRNPSVPILLAAGGDERFAAELRRAWSRAEVSPAEAEALGELLLASEAPVRAVERLERETEAAIDLLGPMRELPWCAELLALVRSFGQSAGETR
ncbi:MAG: polyprenyl synthetase family protein [Myxococcales bacterium]